MRIMSRAEPVHFDVHQESSPALNTWGPGIIYSRLLRFKLGPQVELPSMLVECDLCERWEQPDPKTYIFHLRPGVRWHDMPPVNGRKLTADDLVYSYNRQRTKGWPNADLLGSIDTLEALDDLTLKISLHLPDADFLISLADARSKIVAREAVEESGDLKGGPNVGTGPWLWKDTATGLGSSFERNPHYFEAEVPYLDTLTIQFLPDAETRLAAFRNKAVDVHQMEPEEWREFKERYPKAPFLLYEEPGVGVEIALNTSVPPLDSLPIRKAIFNALDPWGAIQDLWLDTAFVSLGIPVAEPTWLLPQEELRSPFANPDQAKALLVQAGVTSHFEMEMAVGDFGDRYLAYADRVAEELTSIGILPQLRVLNRREFAEKVWYGGDYQMFIGGTAPASSPNSRLFSVFHSRGAWNTAGYRNADLDGLIEEQARELDPQKRRALIQDIQRHILDNAFRFMPATRISLWTWWPQVQNFHPNFANGEYFHWARVWLTQP